MADHLIYIVSQDDTPCILGAPIGTPARRRDLFRYDLPAHSEVVGCFALRHSIAQQVDDFALRQCPARAMKIENPRHAAQDLIEMTESPENSAQDIVLRGNFDGFSRIVQSWAIDIDGVGL